MYATLWDYAKRNGIVIAGMEKLKEDIHEGEETEGCYERNRNMKLGRRL